MRIGFLALTPTTLAMARAWSDAGHQINGIGTKNILDGLDAEPEFEHFCGNAYEDNWDEVIRNSDLIILDFTPSPFDFMGNFFKQREQIMTGKILCHTSPEVGREALDWYGQQGAFTMAIHPATVLAGDDTDKVRFAEAMFAIDADEALLPVAQALVIELGGEPFLVKPEQRASYAEAMGLATTFAEQITSQAMNALGEAGLTEKRAILSPILRGTIERVLAEGAANLEPGAAKNLDEI